ncbi:hypothetical protein PENSPDRAFT_758308 [Peniophora sp. CONT]|nr:hypothetical protein PENSPDRAFT_758308 [Peniophora sp. CONT]
MSGSPKTLSRERHETPQKGQLNQVFEDEKSGSSIPNYTLVDIRSEISSINSALTSLKDADGLSRTAVSSMAYPDGKDAYDAIDSSLANLEDMSSVLERVRKELQRRRKHIAYVVHPVHNKALPIMRLLPDIMPLIFEELVSEFAHRAKKIGWLSMCHVCVAWREVALSMPSVWAREVGVYHSPMIFREILHRAQRAPLTVRNPWRWSYTYSYPLPDHYWPVLSEINRVRQLLLELMAHEDVNRLAGILSAEASSELRSVSVSARGDLFASTYPMMAPHANLRWLSYRNMFIPFHGHSLVGLMISSGYDYNAPSVTCAQFFDILGTCSNLRTIILDQWIPSFTAIPPLLKVNLPCLRTLVARNDLGRVSYMDIVQCLSLPSLTYLWLDDHHNTTHEGLASCGLTVLHWLFSGAVNVSWIEDVDRLSVARINVPDRASHDNFHIRIDRAKLNDIAIREPRFEFPLKETLDLEYGSGFHIRFNHQYGIGSVSNDAFFHGAVAAYLQMHGHSPNVPVLRSVYFDTQLIEVDWDTVLLDLSNVETLFLGEMPDYLSDIHTEYNRDDGILAALSRIGPDGSMLLPRLRTIVINDDLTFLSHPDEWEDERRDVVKPLVCEMLRSRAAHGIPVTCLRTGSATGAHNETERARGANEHLRELVASYMPQVESVN